MSNSIEEDYIEMEKIRKEADSVILFNNSDYDKRYRLMKSYETSRQNIIDRIDTLKSKLDLAVKWIEGSDLSKTFGPRNPISLLSRGKIINILTSDID